MSDSKQQSTSTKTNDKAILDKAFKREKLFLKRNILVSICSLVILAEIGFVVYLVLEEWRAMTQEATVFLMYAAAVLIPLFLCILGYKKAMTVQKDIKVLTTQLKEAGYVARPATLDQARKALEHARVYRMGAIICVIVFVVLEVWIVSILLINKLMTSLGYLLFIPCGILVLVLVFRILYYVRLNVLHRVSQEDQERIIEEYKMSRPSNMEIFIHVSVTVVFIAIVLTFTVFLLKGSSAIDSPSSSTCQSCGRTFQSGDDGGNYRNIAETNMCNNCERNYHLMKQFIED